WGCPPAQNAMDPLRTLTQVSHPRVPRSIAIPPMSHEERSLIAAWTVEMPSRMTPCATTAKNHFPWCCYSEPRPRLRLPPVRRCLRLMLRRSYSHCLQGSFRVSLLPQRERVTELLTGR